MHYEGNMIRPPSEANSILLQATVGCSHNKCTFCAAYKGERFKIKSDDIIMEDIAFAAQYCRRQDRLFLCDGDALIIPQKRLVKFLTEIKRQLPWVTRVGTYANHKSLSMKTLDELKELRELGLKIAYMGLETGDDQTLKHVRKGCDSEKMIAMGQKCREAGIQLSITVLVGLAGRERSQEHAVATGKVLSAIDPEYVGALSLMIVPGTELYKEYEAGDFPILEPEEVLTELGTMIANTNLTNGLFHANHASNYLPIRAKMPEDKEKTLALINKALDGKVALKPEWMRAL
ncbi:Radical SAM superfamily protein [Desulfatibacillum alkenivorans DSM 16219]|uniref:Radical SAM superfamily protein n=1 Tax=Desulfatibacillum alkenivorans DSM 16219 TaxID=1121393 RepID=A0A1M7AGH0_9BACT|nr:radical SAM protein [Desulfatibacillum alkenivorans]SHL41893.1 Radical SAM superfamily protein [Desulfatibacillum alkenivorans DSM 16219]